MKRYETIYFHIEDDVALLILKRPPVNVMNMQMIAEIVDVVISIMERTDLYALLIRAEGKVFSAGVSVEDHLGDQAGPVFQLFLQLFELLIEVPCPTIAVVEGAALGGGCELATFCDMVVATDQAKFGQPEINLGVFPPIAVASFPWMTGSHRTMELLLTGDTISAHKAYEWGLINRVVIPEELETNLEQLLHKLRTKSALSLSLTRKAILKGMKTSYTAAINEAEQIYLKELMSTYDAQEGLCSFIERRLPIWKNI
jgi:cyclohexa-1,5-dienecarbonyl-CoA hydratase